MPILHRTTVVDRTGHGHSSKWEELTEGALAQEAARIKRFGLAETFSLTMHDGTIIGFNPRNCLYAKLEECDE